MITPQEQSIAIPRDHHYNTAMETGHDGGSGQPESRFEHWLTVVAGATGLFSIIFLCYPLLRGNIYLASDLGSFHFPYRSFYSHCLQSGFSPLWWPDQFCGYYTHGEGQAGMAHPFHWLLYRFLSLPLAFNLEFGASYVFMYAGVVGFLRHLRYPWYAALFAATLFTFCGFNLLHFTHMQAIAVMAHLPWMLWATDALLKGSNARQFRYPFVAIALLSGSQLLLGHPQCVVFTLCALGIYVAAHLRTPGVIARIPLLALALCMGLAIGAVQIIPTFDVVGDAQRMNVDGFWQDGSLHPLNLLQWIGPYLFENGLSVGIPPLEYGLYTGGIPLLLALWCATRVFTLGQHRHLCATMLSLAAIALILALGKYGGLYGLLAQLPVLGSFRCSARHVVLIHFALAILAAIALPQLAQQATTGPSVRNRGLWTFVALAWITSLTLWGVQRYLAPTILDGLSDRIVPMCLGPLLLTAGVVLIHWAPRYPRVAITSLMLLAMVDTWVYAYPNVQQQSPQSSRLDALLPVLATELPDDPAFVPGDAHYRAFGNWRVARLTLHGLPNYMGYVGLSPDWQLDVNTNITKQIAGVRWEKVPLSAREWTIHEDALPMARLVTQAIVSTTPREAIEQIDVTTTAIVTEALDIAGDQPGTLSWLKNEPGNVAWQTETTTPQLLVFAQRYHPGWTATIDGNPQPVITAYGDFMGCVVPAGEHTVHFSFWPKSFVQGLWVSGAGLLLTLALWVVFGRMKNLAS